MNKRSTLNAVICLEYHRSEVYSILYTQSVSMIVWDLRDVLMVKKYQLDVKFILKFWSRIRLKWQIKVFKWTTVSAYKRAHKSGFIGAQILRNVKIPILEPTLEFQSSHKGSFLHSRRARILHVIKVMWHVKSRNCCWKFWEFIIVIFYIYRCCMIRKVTQLDEDNTR